MKMTTRLLVLCLALLGCRSADKEAQPKAAPVAPAKATSSEAPKLPTVAVSRKSGEPIQVAVELATTPAQRKKGLMFRESMAEFDGMLFDMEVERIQSFWMKNTLIPLDMLFIDSTGVVVGIVENAEPKTLSPRAVDQPSRFVLEVNGGWCKKHGVAPGDTVDIAAVFGSK